MKMKVVLLTGAPATGKSSLTRTIQHRKPEIQIIDYGALLLAEKNKLHEQATYEELRSKSAKMISTQDVETMDKQILGMVEEKRKYSHVLIDTHCVTKETFGFRLIPFYFPVISALKLDAVISLYCSPEVIVQRIKADPMGRPIITPDQASKHMQLQDGMAGLYGAISGCPVFFVDSSYSLDSLCETVLGVLEIA